MVTISMMILRYSDGIAKFDDDEVANVGDDNDKDVSGDDDDSEDDDHDVGNDLDNHDDVDNYDDEGTDEDDDDDGDDWFMTRMRTTMSKTYTPMQQF